MIHLTQTEYEALVAARQERDRLLALVNSPEVDLFLRGVHLEAVHQVERWGTASDGTVIGAWCAHNAAVVRLVRWGRHLNGPRQPEGWVTITHSVMISNVPTHWIAVGTLPGIDGGKPE